MWLGQRWLLNLPLSDPFKPERTTVFTRAGFHFRELHNEQAWFFRHCHPNSERWRSS